MAAHYFISYSNVDSKIDVRRLADDLAADSPSIRGWVDARELQAGSDWDEQIVEALRTCVGLLFLMTKDSVQPKSECKREWTRGLRYKKPVIPLLCDRDAEMPYRLEPRQHIDFTGAYQQSLAKLRTHLRWRDSPEGELASLKERFADAERALARADEQDKARIEDDITDLKARITTKQRSLDNPTAAAETTQARISSGLERERAPAEPERPETRTKFINPPPASAPTWFQDRHVETGLIGDFLKDDALRLITVVGRGGIGKTAMVCRLLKALESGRLPDDGGPLPVDGIVYLSPIGSRQLTFAHCYADLCKLLPAQSAKGLETIYQNPQATTTAKMQALLEAFPAGRTVVLLDNFEEVVDAATGQIRDAELDEALQALLNLPQHGVRVILTTREAPRQLLLTQPGRQTLLALDQGLESPYAENILKAMDADGKLGLRDAPPALLDDARKRTRGYPRALEALVAILAVDRDTSLAELLADTEQLLPEHVVEALVGEAFSRLDALAQQVMQALALYGRPVAPAAVDYLLQPHVPDIDSAPLLRRLVGMQFARSEAGRYYQHQVDRAYALDRIPEGGPADREATPAPFTRFALRHRAADYFAQTRTPRERWKRIDDLEPQLAEFELRVAGEEYEAAASVLLDIDFDYLQRWGHARLAAECHERLQGRLGDRYLLGASLTNLGNCYFSLGDYPRAIDQHEQSLAIKREIGNRQGEGNSLGNLGNCYRSLGDYRRAIDQHEQSLAIAREIGNRQGEGNSLGNLGNCYRSLGDYRRAIDQHEQSLAIAREIGDRYGEGTALGNLGNCYYSLGDYPRAIDQHEQSLAIKREIGNRQGEGNSLGNLGNCYYSLGDYPRAIDQHEQSLAIKREIGNRQGEGNSLGNLGNCYYSLGDYRRAIDQHEQSLAIAREIGNRQGEGNSLGNLGNCYRSLGDYRRAIDQHEQSLAIAREIGDRQGEGNSLGNLGNCYRSLGDYRRAIDQHEQSLAIKREIGNRQGEGNSLGNLGNCYYSLGDYRRAIDQYEQSLAIAREIGDRQGEGNSLIGLGNCYFSLGDYRRAIDQHEQSLAIKREIGDRQGESAALTNLADVYRDTGDGARAISHYQDALRLADATGNAQNRNEAQHGLALAHLYAGDLALAHGAIEAAQAQDYPENNAAVWAAAGIIRLRQRQDAAAREAFSSALAEADGLLEKTARNLSALDSKALALCGLALCEDASHVAAAVAVYRAARKISKAAGVTASALKRFDALAAADAAGVLSGVRNAVAGQ